MVSKTSKPMIIIAILGNLAYIILITAMVILPDLAIDAPVPIMGGMQNWLYLTIFAIIWPILGSILGVLIIPRLLVPAYLKLKNKGMKKYQDGYIQLDPSRNTTKKMVSRAFIVFLMIIGLESTVIPLLDLKLFIPETAHILEEESLYYLIKYEPQVFNVTASMMLPLAVGLWACVWTIEDSGLVHYNLSQELSEFQELEPVHFKLAGIFKGFAGGSSFFYYLTAIMEIHEAHTDVVDINWVIFFSIISMFWALIGILFYNSRDPSWVKKGLKKTKRLAIEEIMVEDD